MDEEVERDLKKIVFVGSKAEEMAHKINKQYDIRLGRETRHFETEKTVFLKGFKAEQQATLEKQQRVKERLRELRLKNKAPPPSRVVIADQTAKTQARVRFFITESKNNFRKNSKMERRAKSAPETRKSSQIQFMEET
jgi:hypothetical protein